MNLLHDFARRYTSAWCSQNAASVAAFFAFDGSLQVNDGPAAVGRPAITAVARGFMTDFPDLKVSMDALVETGEQSTVDHWTLDGHHAATNRHVRVSGFEEWTIGDDGLIAESKGHFDSAEYQKQISGIDSAGA